MNISEIQQPSPPRQIEGETETKQSRRARKGSRAQTEDLVELSSSLGKDATKQLEEEQAQRVATLKARLQEGTYQVDSTLVAGKMLSFGSGL